MPNYIRPAIPGATVFFTVVLAQRGDDMLHREVATLRDAVRETRAELPFGIAGWVVLPDHMHTIWTLPPGDSDFSTRWQRIKGRFSRSVGVTRSRSASKRAKGEAGIWQRRFWDHHIRDRADLEMHLRYCWADPVRHGLVARAADWPLSSIHRDIAQGRIGRDWSGPSPDGAFGE